MRNIKIVYIERINLASIFWLVTPNIKPLLQLTKNDNDNVLDKN